MSFKIIYKERIKEFAVITSLGMNKKQRRKMIIKEAIIIATIGIIIGTCISIIISLFGINFLDVLISRTQSVVVKAGAKLLIDSTVKLYMVLHFTTYFIIVILIYLITIIAALLSTRMLNKLTLIEAIRNTKDNHLQLKQKKVPKIILKLFKQEGELAYKNMKKDKTKYKTIVISISISIVLVLSISRILQLKLNNISEYEFYGQNDYKIYVYTDNLKEDTKEIISYLERKELIRQHLIVEQPMELTTLQLIVPKNKLSNEAKILAERRPEIVINECNEGYAIFCNIYVASGNEYEEILRNCGIEKLNEEECIFIDAMEEKTKYFDKMRMTNCEAGDTLVIKEIDETLSEYEIEKGQEIMNMLNITSDNTYTTNEESLSEIKKAEYMLKIAAISESKSLFMAPCIVINEETLEKWGIKSVSKELYLKTDEPYEIDNVINEISDIFKEKNKENSITGTNLYQESVAINSENLIKEIVIYTFIIFITMFSIVNIFNVIFSSIILRKKEFAVLKSMGMSEKQISKMLRLEEVLIVFDAVFYGVLIGLVVLYIIYILMENFRLYAFKFPIIEVIITIFITYIIVLVATQLARKQIKNQNVIDEIRKENI